MKCSKVDKLAVMSRIKLSFSTQTRQKQIHGLECFPGLMVGGIASGGLTVGSGIRIGAAKPAFVTYNTQLK